MRKTALVGLLLAGSMFTPAVAADLGRPVYQAPAVVAVPAGNWNGFYIGVQGGYGWGNADGVFNDDSSSLYSRRNSLSGGMFGGLMGWNFQSAGSPWVWGFETDINWSGIKGNSAELNLLGNDRYRTEIDWYGTARGRLGYSWGPSMLYATGGFAYGQVKNGYIDPRFAFGANDYGRSGTKVGYTVGAGWEYMFGPGWTARIEYNYVNLGSQDLVYAPGFDHTRFTNDFSVIKGGVTYKFNSY